MGEQDDLVKLRARERCACVVLGRARDRYLKLKGCMVGRRLIVKEAYDWFCFVRRVASCAIAERKRCEEKSGK